jgi:hypothetical protein
MDDYMFKANVDRCKHVTELTTYLEIFSYSVSFSYQRAVAAADRRRIQYTIRLKSIL